METSKNCNSGYAIYEPQISLENKEELSFIEEKGELGRGILRQESIVGSWEFKVQ